MNTSRVGLDQLPLPTFYNESQTREINYRPSTNAIEKEARQWKKQFDLKSVGTDRKKVHLLVIDDQNDFSFPEGSLYVGGRSGTGAMDAQKNLVEFVYRYLHVVSQITCTMDTHNPYQVFFTSAHLRADGSRPEAHTIISADEYEAGEYRPDPVMARHLGVDVVWLAKQFPYYCRQLEKSQRLQLYLWPYHCLLGSQGHLLTGAVEAMRLFHGFARGADNLPETKGSNPLTEHYSIFAPEVATTWEGKPIPHAERNYKLIKKLVEADIVILAGLASSHCLKYSGVDFLSEIAKQDANLPKKVYVLSDCTAPVVVPGGKDFTKEAQEGFDFFERAGAHIVSSTKPIEDWPGIKL